MVSIALVCATVAAAAALLWLTRQNRPLTEEKRRAEFHDDSL